ncbi:cytoplasmic beta-actin-like protein [Camelus ferus]|nr:cytoplasmic beta-actin-like protein [Camelus ferus]
MGQETVTAVPASSLEKSSELSDCQVVTILNECFWVHRRSSTLLLGMESRGTPETTFTSMLKGDVDSRKACVPTQCCLGGTTVYLASPPGRTGISGHWPLHD